MTFRLALLALLWSSLFAAEPTSLPNGVTVWPKGVPPGGQAAKFDNHSISVSHRDKSGVAEYHEKQNDILIIQTGTAVLEVGGEVVDPKTTAPGEIRGPSIRGGVKRNVGPGDMIHIPAKTAHQFFLKPGTQITYLAIKVDIP